MFGNGWEHLTFLTWKIVNKYNEAMRVDPIPEVQQSRHILDKFDTHNFHLRFTVNTLAGRECWDTNLSRLTLML